MGRLLTLRLKWPVTDAEAMEIAAEASNAITFATEQVVAAVDLRGARAFPVAITDLFIDLLRAGDTRIERTALLVASDAGTLRLQAERALRGASNPNRRIFDDPAAFARWLGETLTAIEAGALEQFLIGT